MQTIKLGDIAIEAKESNKGDKTGCKIVGLEHLTPSDVTLSAWSDDTNNSFTKEFSKGDVLFGRRRAYLKKAALAPFDGICSGDITVIRAKEGKVDPRLLPFIIQNDFLFEFAVEKSAGSLSPRVKWEHLRNFEISLPDTNKQRELADILWSINETKQAYLKLIKQTDELVKSQFIEMFGSKPRVRLGDYIDQVRGISYKPVDLNEELIETHVTLLRANNINRGQVNFDEVQYVCRKKVSDAQYIQEKDIIMCASSGSLEHVGKTALCEFGGEYTFGAFCKLIRAKSILKPEYIAAYFLGDEYRAIISNLAQGSNINNLRNEHIDELQIPMASDEEQNAFITFKRQSDKSKFELQDAIDNLDALSKKIIAENLIAAGKE